MRRIRRLRITTVRAVSAGEPAATLFCGRCREIVASLTFDQLAAVLGTDQEGVACLVAGGRAHLATTASGDARICGRSLQGRLSAPGG